MNTKKIPSRPITFFTYPEIVERNLSQYGAKFQIMNKNKLAKKMLSIAQIKIMSEDILERNKYEYLLAKSYSINGLAKAFNTDMLLKGFVEPKDLYIRFKNLTDFQLLLEQDLAMIGEDYPPLKIEKKHPKITDVVETKKAKNNNKSIRSENITFRLRENEIAELENKLKGCASVGQCARDVFENKSHIRYISHELKLDKVVLVSRVTNNLNQIANVLSALNNNQRFKTIDVYFNYLRVIKNIESIYVQNLSVILVKSSHVNTTYVDDRDDRFIA